jgi:hypothetical protein
MVAFAEDDHIHEAVNRLSITLPSSTRASMQEYSPHGGVEFPLCVNDGGVDPPLYDANTFLQTHPLTKYNIQPREDEGQEILPQYSSAISLENVLLRKVELEGAIHRASNRNWKRVYATLQGTALKFYEYKPSRYFPGWLSEGAKGDVAIPALKGQFFKSYNLQYADVGIAADYYKYFICNSAPKTLRLTNNAERNLWYGYAPKQSNSSCPARISKHSLTGSNSSSQQSISLLLSIRGLFLAIFPFLEDAAEVSFLLPQSLVLTTIRY